MRSIFRRDGRFCAEDFVRESGLFDGLAEEPRLAFARHADVLGSRRPEGERRREVARAVVIERAPARFVRRVAVRIGDVGVDRTAVGRDETADEVRRAHAPFDLERIDARLDQLRDGAVHAHVVERELVRPRTVLVEDGARRLIDECERPATRLHAAPAVAALTEYDARMDALAALGDTHVAVHEVFDLDARARAKERELRERHLTADNDAGDAVFLELFDGVLVVRIHHDGGVQRHADAHLVHELKHGEILYENGIRANLVEIGEIVAQGGQLLVADEVVERDVKLHVVRVRVLDRGLEARVVKVKVPFVETHIEMFAAEIDGVRPRLDARGHGVPCAGGREQFDGFTV